MESTEEEVAAWDRCENSDDAASIRGGQGCRDARCWVRLFDLVGQHTNGGCHCLSDVTTRTRLAVQKKISLLRTEVSEWHGLSNAQEKALDAATEKLKEATMLLSRIDDAYDRPDWSDRETANTVMDSIKDWLGDNGASAIGSI